MAYSKILVGYDCSQAATRALSDAYELVDHRMADAVIVLMVTDPERTGDPAFNAAARAAGVLLSTIGDEEEALGNLKKSLGDEKSPKPKKSPAKRPTAKKAPAKAPARKRA